MKRSFNLMGITLIYSMVVRTVIAIILPLHVVSRGFFIDMFLLIALFMIVTFGLRKLIYQKIFYSSFIVLWTVVAITDIIFYQYFNTLTTRMNAQGLSFMSTDLAVEYDLALLPAIFLALVIIVGMVLVIAKQKHKDVFLKEDIYFLAIIIFANVSFILHLHRQSPEMSIDYYQSDTYLYQSMYDTVNFSDDFGYYFYHLVDLTRVIPVRYDLDDETIEDFLTNSHVVNQQTNRFKNSNIVHIVVESLDTRFIDQTLTPTLYTMMQDGYQFPNYYVPVVNQGATCNTEFMSLTGIYAYPSHSFMNNVCHSYRNNHFEYSIPNQLNAIGYDTYYFHAGYEWFYQRETLMPNIGFDEVYFVEDLRGAGFTDYNLLYDPDSLLFFETYLDTTNPFYVNFLTYGLHGAYNEAVYPFLKDELDDMYQDYPEDIRVYLQKMMAFDIFVEDLVMYLKAMEVYDDTLFVFHTDHYPFMLDMDHFEDYTGVDPNTTELYQQTLFMYQEGMTPTTFEGLGSTIDIAPTLLNLVHGEAEYRYFFGQDIVSNRNKVVLLPNGSVTDGNNHFYLNKPYEGTVTKEAALRYALEKKLIDYEYARAILERDYFN